MKTDLEVYLDDDLCKEILLKTEGVSTDIRYTKVITIWRSQSNAPSEYMIRTFSDEEFSEAILCTEKEVIQLRDNLTSFLKKYSKETPNA